MFRELVQKLLTLPFIPVTDIHVVFDDIITNMPEFDEIEEQVFDLINYIEVTYVRGRAARGRRAATNPRFGPEIWSVYDLVLNISCKYFCLYIIKEMSLTSLSILRISCAA